MKLFRHGPPGEEKPGVLTKENEYRDTSPFGEDYDEHFFASDGIDRMKHQMERHLNDFPVLTRIVRFGPPVKKPSKIVCIGLNYSEHSKESLMALTPEPVVFFKSTTAICGPDDRVIIPKNSLKTDWEVELAVVIGKKASYVEEKDALDYVAGYTIHNDYSEREFQLEHSGQWVKGKSCDTFAPLGPLLLTPDEIPDLNNLRLWLFVNGKIMQDGHSGNMIFKVPFLISYLSRFMTLLPGDIISTGTPSGVGLGQKPEPVYLKPGDVVELGIDGFGSAKQELVSWQKSNK
jgi:2-keto-4-pentenoate hydratase/2-oxohepta-3-ene-1,7-dioic acid hydratase in catechol pathway